MKRKTSQTMKAWEKLLKPPEEKIPHTKFSMRKNSHFRVFFLNFLFIKNFLNFLRRWFFAQSEEVTHVQTACGCGHDEVFTTECPLWSLLSAKNEKL